MELYSTEFNNIKSSFKPILKTNSNHFLLNANRLNFLNCVKHNRIDKNNNNGVVSSLKQKNYLDKYKDSCNKEKNYIKYTDDLIIENSADSSVNTDKYVKFAIDMFNQIDFDIIKNDTNFSIDNLIFTNDTTQYLKNYEMNVSELEIIGRCEYCGNPIYKKVPFMTDTHDNMYCSLECTLNMNEIRIITED